jgi:hypothetical protein
MEVLAYSFQIQPVLPMWAWWGLLLIVMLATLASFHHRPGRVWAGWRTVGLLLGLRTLALLLLLLTLLQPQVRWETQQPQRGVVWVAVDTSASMGLADRQYTLQEAVSLAPLVGVKLPPEWEALGELHDRLQLLSGLWANLAQGAGPKPELVTQVKHIRKLQTSPLLAEVIKQGLNPLLNQIETTLANPQANNHASIASALDAARRDTQQRWLSALTAPEYTPLVKSLQMNLQPLARRELVSRAWSTAQADPAFQQWQERYTLRWLGFAQQPTLIAPSADAQTAPFTTLFKELGTASNLGLPLDEIRPSEAGGIALFFSDGLHNAGDDPLPRARLLGSRQLPVITLPAGSALARPDAQVLSLTGPERIQAGDTVELQAVLRAEALRGQPLKIVVRRDDAVIQQLPWVPDSSPSTLRLPVRDVPTGQRDTLRYEVEIQPHPSEANTQNNRRSWLVRLQQERSGILIADRFARWDTQILTHMLRRQKTYQVQRILFSPLEVVGVARPQPRAAALGPAVPLDAEQWPATKPDWQPFGLIILGDLTPQELPLVQQEQILTLVRDHGATLVIQAGREAMPHAFRNQPLEELLPITLTSRGPGFAELTATAGYQVVNTPMSLDTPWALSELSGGEILLPRWYWHHDLLQPRPAAQVWWTLAGAQQQNLPPALLCAWNYGTGRVLYLGSEQLWRWQSFGATERFWQQVLRWSASDELPAGGQWVRFGATPLEANSDQTVVITARVRNRDASPLLGIPVDAVLQPETGPAQRLRLEPVAQLPGYYQGRIKTLPAGRYRLTLAGTQVEELLATDPQRGRDHLMIQINTANGSETTPQAINTALLSNIAGSSGGQMLTLNRLSWLADLTQSQQRFLTEEHAAGFFNAPEQGATKTAHGIAWAVVCGCLLGEWFLRRRRGMV